MVVPPHSRYRLCPRSSRPDHSYGRYHKSCTPPFQPKATNCSSKTFEIKQNNVHRITRTYSTQSPARAGETWTLVGKYNSRLFHFHVLSTFLRSVFVRHIFIRSALAILGRPSELGEKKNFHKFKYSNSTSISARRVGAKRVAPVGRSNKLLNIFFPTPHPFLELALIYLYI